MPHRQRHHGRAFTLVELLVVIGVVSLLMAILFPTLSVVRERATHTQCLSNLRQIGVGFATYEADCGRLPAHPFEAGDLGTFPASIRGPIFDTREILRPYLNVDYFVCPGVSPWKPSELDSPVINIDYFLTPGYYGDAHVADPGNPASAVFVGRPWTKSNRPWRYGPYAMRVVAGDKLYLDTMSTPGTWRHVVNHPGRNNGYGEWAPPGFAGTAWLANHPAGTDQRNRLRGNFLFADGSAHTFGPDAEMVRVPSRHVQRPGCDYLMPVGR